MAESPDIVDVANAAMRLGDVFAPPIGSTIRRRWEHIDRFSQCLGKVVSGLAVNYTVIHGRETYSFDVIYEGTEVALITFPEYVEYTIVSVPDGAPPFDQWERPQT